jgi:hypothetical protein
MKSATQRSIIPDPTAGNIVSKKLKDPSCRNRKDHNYNCFKIYMRKSLFHDFVSLPLFHICLFIIEALPVETGRYPIIAYYQTKNLILFIRHHPLVHVESHKHPHFYQPATRFCNRLHYNVFHQQALIFRHRRPFLRIALLFLVLYDRE